MHFVIFVSIFIASLLFGDELDSLLNSYDESSKKSLSTLNDKMGHVIIYTQNDLNAMNYKVLLDVLKELPDSNLNTNRFGLQTLSLSGAKTDVSGFFRLYINDHEVSFAYTQTPSLHWIDLPISSISHIEIYYGEGSFTLGSTNGVRYIRVYTKNGAKDNGNSLESFISNRNYNSISLTHSNLLENGWAYMLHTSNQHSSSHIGYKDGAIQNDYNKEYLLFNANNENNNIDFGYSKIKKDPFVGYATDLLPDDGKLDSYNFFVHTTSYFLNDKSLKASLSYDVTSFKHYEKNTNGLFIPPIINLTNMATMPKYLDEELKFKEFNALISKSFSLAEHKLFTAINYKNLKYDTLHRDVINMANQSFSMKKFNDFDKENLYSIMFEDDYKLRDDLHLIAEYKYNKYNKSSTILDNDAEHMYRVGGIYLPTKNLGFKAFYTKSHVAPTFYNVDYIRKTGSKLKTQQYNYYTLEGVFSYDKHRFNLDYHKVAIDDFIHYTPVGFENVKDTVRADGFIADYEYSISRDSKLSLNYYHSSVNQQISNSRKGGYAKFNNTNGYLDYYALVIFKNAYKYLDSSVDASYNLNLGLRYNYSKNLSFSLSGNNLLKKPTKSIFTDTSGGFTNQTNSAFSDEQRSIYFGARLMF